MKPTFDKKFLEKSKQAKEKHAKVFVQGLNQATKKEGKTIA